ncbi:hypothetical protein Hanom_Chr14g01310171 [Helianthus anomalus]
MFIDALKNATTIILITLMLKELIEKLRQGNSEHFFIHDFKNHRRCSESFHQVLASKHTTVLIGVQVSASYTTIDC